MKSKTFTIPTSFYDPIKGWSNEDIGILFRAIFLWKSKGIDYEGDDSIGLVFGLMKASIEAMGGLQPAKAKEKSNPPMSPELKASVDRVYYAYPSKCPKGKSSTGKSFKDKTTIAKRLEMYSEEYLIKAINIYIDGEKKADRWIKNFSTFLNNIPDIEDSSNGISMSEKRIMWHVDPTNNTRTGTKEQYEADIKRYGKNSVKFIGDAV